MLVQWPGDEATLKRGQHACAVAWGQGYTHTSVKRPAWLCSGLGTRLHTYQCKEASMVVQWPGDEGTHIPV